MFFLSHETAFSQSEITVEPGENTLLNAVSENPGSTLILKRGEEYVIDRSIQIIVPTIIKCEEYTLADPDPPAVISFHAAPGEAGDKLLFSVAADVTIKDLGFIGFTFDNQQIYGVLEVTSEFLNVEVEGCVVQSVNTFILTNDVTGAEVATLVSKHQIASRYEIMFDDTALSAGVYLCKIQAGNLSQHQKMTLVK